MKDYELTSRRRFNIVYEDKKLAKAFSAQKKKKKLARIDLGIILSWGCFTKKSFGNPEFWKLQIFLHTFHSIIIVFTSADFIFLSAVLNSTVSTLNMVFFISLSALDLNYL